MSLTLATGLDARELWDKQMQKQNSIQIQETSSDEISYSEPSHTNLSNSENLTAEKRNLSAKKDFSRSELRAKTESKNI